jgi:1,4-dihydroxy-2-naphthoyl-CoA hydrolase
MTNNKLNTNVNIQELNERCKNTMVEFLEIKFTEVGEDYLKATMPVSNKTCQPLQMLNGGASLALAESLGSMAANLALDRDKFVALGLDINANHLKSEKVGGFVTGIARPFHIGKTTQVWEIKILNTKDELVCISRLTMAVIAIA